MLPANQRLGDFEILRLLGRGGMGEVYEARQHNPDRLVAIKVMAPALSANPDAVERFQREAAALARLDHPGIVPIFTTGRTPEGTFYFSMRLVRGVSLARLLRGLSHPSEAATAQAATISAGQTPAGLSPPATDPPGEPPAALGRSDPVPPELLRPYAEDRYGFTRRAGIALAETLAAAHREKVLHRDLKPANVMLSRDSHLYLMDFGLALLLDGPDGTLAGTVKGTPWYMAPEQARAEPVDERSDVYSLGVLLYELATGGIGPFAVDRSDIAAVLEAVRAGALLPLRTLAPEVPERLARVIARATALCPEDRYASAADLLADLQREPDSATPLRGATPPAVPAVAARRVGWKSLAALAGVLVVLLVAWRAWPWGKAPDPGSGQGPEPVVPQPLAVADPWPFDPGNRLPAHRQHQWGVPLSLLKDGCEPVWHLRLWGELPDGFQVLPWDRGSCRLRLASLKGRSVYLLDYDTARNGFRFETDLNEAGTSPLTEAGVLFGYRRNVHDPEHRSPFFMARLVEAAGNRPARLLVGITYLDEKRGDRVGVSNWFQRLPGGLGELVLPERIAQRKGWRHLEVWADEARVILTVDHLPAARLELCVARLRGLPRGGDLDPRGGVGIWASHCLGEFRGMTFTPLPPGAAGP